MLILSVSTYYRLLLINIVEAILFSKVVLILLYNILIIRLRRIIVSSIVLSKRYYNRLTLFPYFSIRV